MLAMLLILQVMLVINHIVQYHDYSHEVEERSHPSILHIHILILVACEGLAKVLGNQSKLEVLHQVFSHVPQFDITKV